MKNRFVNTLAVVGCTVSTAFAADLSNQKNDSFPMQKKVIVDDAVIYAPRPTQEMLDNPNLYEKIRILSEPILENSKQVGEKNTYMYLSLQPIMYATGYNYSVYQTQADFYHNNDGHVYLTGYFMYNYEKVSCYDVLVTKSSNVINYQEKLREIRGNGTSKATVKLKFTYDNRWGDTRKESLFLACTKDGGSSCR